MSNPIVTENALAGTPNWFFNFSATTEIQAYADKDSCNPGDTIHFFTSVSTAGMAYTLEIFRLGWYQGLGARLQATMNNASGTAQGYWNANTSTLVSCPTAIIDSTTHNIEAGWTSTDSWTVPANACTGIYLAKFTRADSPQTGVILVVKGNSSADYVVSHPFATDWAYNNWGGHSLYTSPTVDVKVSANKPAASYDGTSNVGFCEIPVIRWLEAQGYDLSYISDIDMHTTPSLLLNHKAYLSLGHDEYWTKEMRNGVESAIAARVSAAFLGADTCFWQCRLENDNAGHANRTVVCYKVQSNNQNLSNDPLYGVDNTRVTTYWSDALLNRPQATMTGLGTGGSFASSSSNVAWVVDANPDTTYFAGTGLVAGQSYGGDEVGYESDKIVAASPSNIKTIATTTFTDVNSNPGQSNTTFYRAASGALVFASGSISWTWCLDTFRWQHFSYTPVVIPGMQILFGNIMAALKGPVYSMIQM